MTSPTINDEQVDVQERIAFAPRRIGHMNIFISQLDRSMQFYEQVCGLQTVGRSDKIGAGFVSNGNTHHDVGCLVATGKGLVAKDGHVSVPKTRGHAPGLNHIGWEMENEWELVEAYKRAVAAGLKIHRTVDHGISRSVYIFDPEGFLHEIYADTVTDWRSIFASDALESLTTGWTPGEETPSKEPRYEPAPAFQSVPGAVFHAQQLRHCALMTRRYERMKNFYVNVIGMRPIRESTDPNIVWLGGKAGGVDIILIERKPEELSGMHHFSLQVSDSDQLLAGARRFAESAGGEVDHVLDLPHKLSVFIRDPDGMRVELFTDRNPAAAPDTVQKDLASFVC